METQTATAKKPAKNQDKKLIDNLRECQASQGITMPPDLWETMKSQGMPVKIATFYRSVTACNGTPESAFYAKGQHIESRIAKMWYAPCGLLCEQAKGERIIVPHSNIVYAKML